MRVRNFICCAAFALSIMAAADQGIPARPQDLRFTAANYVPPKAADYRHKLKSGMVVFAVEDHKLPLVHIGVMVRTGSYLDPAGKTGLASLAGSQIRAGGTKSKPPAQFDDEADFLAANLSSMMGSAEGQASLNCMSKDLDAGLAMFVDMLRNPGFDEKRFSLAKMQAMQGLERRNDRTDQIESREFERLMRGDRHFTTAQVTKASIEAITRQDLIDFHQKYYFPTNFVIAVSGDFKTGEMLAKLESAFAGWQNAGQKPPTPPAPEFTPAPGVYIVNKPVNQGRVRLGEIGVTMSNPDHIAITVMNGVLGGSGFTSRIMSRVRSDEGLAYSAGSRFMHGDYYPGLFTAYFQSKSESVAQAVAIVQEEIERIRKTPVTKEELDTELNSLVESLPRRFATASSKANSFASDYYRGLPEDYWQKYRDRVKAVTTSEVQRVAQKYLVPEKLVILVVGDADAMLKGNPDKPQYSLTKFGTVKKLPLPDPVTMVYPAQ